MVPVQEHNWFEGESGQKRSEAAPTILNDERSFFPQLSKDGNKRNKNLGWLSGKEGDSS
jgi:hypothetical protein